MHLGDFIKTFEPRLDLEGSCGLGKLFAMYEDHHTGLEAEDTDKRSTSARISQGQSECSEWGYLVVPTTIDEGRPLQRNQPPPHSAAVPPWHLPPGNLRG